MNIFKYIQNQIVIKHTYLHFSTYPNTHLYKYMYVYLFIKYIFSKIFYGNFYFSLTFVWIFLAKYLPIVFVYNGSHGQPFFSSSWLDIYSFRIYPATLCSAIFLLFDILFYVPSFLTQSNVCIVMCTGKHPKTLYWH